MVDGLTEIRLESDFSLLTNESTPVDPLRRGYSIGSQYTINDCTVEGKKTTKKTPYL